MTFRPEKQHITLADGTIFQPACYASDYDWSQHVSEEAKLALRVSPIGYNWSQHVSEEVKASVLEAYPPKRRRRGGQAEAHIPDDYNWEQHVSDEVRLQVLAEVGTLPSGIDWTQQVSVETRDHVRGLCTLQAEADQLAYVATLGEKLDEVSLAKIEASKSHNGTARRYDDKPTPEAKALAKLYSRIDKAAPKNAEYAEKMLAFASLVQDGSLTAKQAVDAAKIANQERKAAITAKKAEEQ
jgi:hypothetical protein